METSSEDDPFDPLLRLRDPNLQKEFEEFSQKTATSVPLLFVFNILFTAALLTGQLSCPSKLEFTIALAACLSSWSLTLFPPPTDANSALSSKLFPLLYIQRKFVRTFSVRTLALLSCCQCCRALISPSSSSHLSFDCTTILSTIILSALLNEEWTISLGLCVIVPIVLAPVRLSVPVLLVALLTIDRRRQQLIAFGLQRKVTRLDREQEKIARAVQTIEMRHIIANVAHDLKTVSLSQ